MTFNGLEDSVVISAGERFIVPCMNCGNLESEHDNDADECGWYVPDLEAAEERYIEEHEWDQPAEKLAFLIKMPTEQWEGKCALIAQLMITEGMAPEGTVDVHGMWLGPISPRSKVFSGRSAAQHHWLLTREGKILDPTRWCFEGVRPYIFHGTDDDGYYDEGANRFNEAVNPTKPFPKIDDGDKITEIDFGEANRLIAELANIPPATRYRLNFARAMWLANLPYDRLGDKALKIYAVLEAHEWGALIPYDNWLRANRQG